MVEKGLIRFVNSVKIHTRCHAVVLEKVHISKTCWQDLKLEGRQLELVRINKAALTFEAQGTINCTLSRHKQVYGRDQQTLPKRLVLCSKSKRARLCLKISSTAIIQRKALLELGIRALHIPHHWQTVPIRLQARKIGKIHITFLDNIIGER